ncbi:hypothetical protein, partial [Ralstonia pseudosolanacearum]|uniref:hypothetical protein n=1 Tax=Ralstonia pseudosolanacearum TaxID=1310165 RepID=UPI001FF8AA6E
MKEGHGAAQCAIFADQNIFPHYEKRRKRSLQADGYRYGTQRPGKPSSATRQAKTARPGYPRP